MLIFASALLMKMTLCFRNVVPVTSPDAAMSPANTAAPRAEVLEEPSHWRSGPPQNPNVQSRSFKILQQQLATE